MSGLAESQEKERRVHAALSRLGYDSLIITRRDNFAWLSCGRRAVVSYVVPESPVLLVVTPHGKYAVGYTMDVPRTMDEELAGQGYEPVSLPTFGKSPGEAALELAEGRVAADGLLPGTDDIGNQIVALHEPYTPQEMERYRTLGQETGEILHDLAGWVQPGMTERQVFAHMWELYLAHGFEGNCMFVGADDRIRRYRHPVPGDIPIEKAVLLAPAVSKWGLHALTSRMVTFGEPPGDTRRRYQAVASMQAAIVAATRPGVRLSTLLNLCLDMFESLGYPDERTNHFHGGPTGYRASYAERCQDPNAIVQVNTAFGWYLTVAGVKSEELILVDDQGAEIRSVDPEWPRIEIEIEGQTVAVPDILVR